MTAPLAERVAAALAEHADPPGWECDDDGRLVFMCECGDWMLGGADDHVRPEDVDAAGDWHNAHQADAVLRVVAEWLGSEDVLLVIETALGIAEQLHAEDYQPQDGAAVVQGWLEALTATGDATRPPDAPNGPAPVSQDPRGAQGGAEGRDEGGAL